MFTVGMGLWWAVFAIGRGLWWAMFVVRRELVGADSGPLSSPLVGWCWAVVVVREVVLGHCRRSWGGAGPGSSSLMLGVVMGHRLGGWWWALVAVHVDTLLLHSIIVVIVHPLSSCCVGSKSDDER